MITIENYDGSKLTLEKPCKRIVSLVPSITETIYELGAGERVVGITEFCVKPWKFYKSKQKVGGTKNPNIEKIRLLRPDIILCNKEENTRVAVEKLREICPVHVSYPTTIEMAKELVMTLGKITGCKERAEEINNRIDESLKNAKENPPLLGGKRALYLVWKNPFMTISAETYIYDVIIHAHLKPILFAKSERYPRILEEEIANSQAEVVIFPDEPWRFTYSDIEEFRQKIKHLPAVMEHALFKIEGSYVSWFGYRTSLALEYMLRCMNLP